jgi:hypothetical protein
MKRFAVPLVTVIGCSLLAVIILKPPALTDAASQLTDSLPETSGKPSYTIKRIDFNRDKDLWVYEVMNNEVERWPSKEQRASYETIEEKLFDLATTGEAATETNGHNGRVWMPANKYNAWWMRLKVNPGSTQGVTEVRLYKEGRVAAAIDFKRQPDEQDLKLAADSVRQIHIMLLGEQLPETSVRQKGDNTYYLHK